ncbi:non-homologous end-joining DNA ligase [Luteimonas kalidii]|uniref:DNA ligase (ATP) n=1 Tax=Luteimonas kalidii TaxID=3042025 RepID=A0ABT6JPM0_9GAMM|nr:non-homologous end-joining DNA ligase [Luteimonas kalidii]MDH5832627.1 non-homologous end-joining DNA ligase [Luteimonas kalidii]
MALEDYRRKRRFGQTPEPDDRARRGARGSRPMFVVQLHHASRRHYDFRLQVGDVLRSWAVPKGPSFDPKVKRMAVEVEDHPLDYAAFEGEIPAGHYGAGHVALFDRGTWTTEGDVAAQLAKGHLRFELHGTRLKGGWHLVRSGKPARQPQWLLFKQNDAWAGPAEADDLLEGVTPPPATGHAANRTSAARAKRGGGDARKPTRRQDPAPARTRSEPGGAKAATRAGTGRTRRTRIDWRAEADKLPDARRLALPEDAPEPQLARLVAQPPEGGQWLHELKWDGYRLLASLHDGVPRLWSRNGLDWTDRVPEARDALAALGPREALMDGELIAVQGRREDFNALQQVLSGERQGRLRLVLFDLLHLDGIDLRRAPLLARKQLLERLLAKAPDVLGYSSHGLGDGGAAFQAALDAGFEGIISKRIDAAYHPGRGDDWRKTKAQASAEYAVVGYTPPKGSRRGIGALLLATPDGTHGWRYVGRVGSGFSDTQLTALGERLSGKGRDAETVYVPEHDTDLRQAKWLPRPAFVVEVFHRGTGGRGLLRQASFKALRPDKPVSSLADAGGDRIDDSAEDASMATRDTRRAGTQGSKPKQSTNAGKAAKAAKATKSATEVRKANKRSASASKTTASTSTRARKQAGGADKAGASSRRAAAGTSRATPAAKRARGGTRSPPALSSPEKVLFPDDGITKQQLADYYTAAMDWLLPEIEGRPLSLVRCPGGLRAQCFFQKHATPGMDLVSKIPLKESDGGREDYLYVTDAASVLELVQFNTLEFHPWGAHVDDVEHCDRLVFDLDPDTSIGWPDVVAAARQLRGFLSQAGLESFVRTTGGKGLHLVVPLSPAEPWERARAFAQAVAEAAREADPLRYVATASKQRRKGRIFIDWLRNGRGATSVASFSVRARAGAPVCMPLRWEELGRVRAGNAWDIGNALARLKRLKRHPWDGIDAVVQSLPG